jgi:hypothetical protein
VKNLFRKTSYNVSVEGGMGIEVKSFNNKPDTIKNDYNIIAMDLWHANGYVTVASNFYYEVLLALISFNKKWVMILFM